MRDHRCSNCLMLTGLLGFDICLFAFPDFGIYVVALFGPRTCTELK